jgi:hypothetical protein
MELLKSKKKYKASLVMSQTSLGDVVKVNLTVC